MALATSGIWRGSLEIITNPPQSLPNKDTRLVALGAGDSSSVVLTTHTRLCLGFGH